MNADKCKALFKYAFFLEVVIFLRLPPGVQPSPRPSPRLNQTTSFLDETFISELVPIGAEELSARSIGATER